MRNELTLSLPATTRINPLAVVRYLPAVGRVLMGLLFLLAGLNGFLNFLPEPTTPMPAGAVDLSVALFKSGYMMQLIAATQTIAAILLLTNRFVPLALLIIAPVIVNIVAFHVFLSPSGLPMAGFVTLVEITLAWQHRAAFRSVLAAR